MSKSADSKYFFITKNEYDSIDECNCGGPIFKYHDTSRNKYIIKCGYFKKVIDFDKQTKRRIWITPKKSACDWMCVYNGERPIFKEINNTLIKSITKNKNEKNIHEQLEQKLKVLFKFLYVSTHSSTLDEINILVKFHLLREPRKRFYYPTTDLIMRFSEESFEDYEKRIFSEKILDLYETIKEKEKINCPITLPFLKNTKNIPTKVLLKKKTISQFVEVTDDEESDKETEDCSDEEQSSNDSSEEDSDRGQSDFESVFDEPEEIEEIYEENDYYDDD
jgi:hypothetical protein